MITVDVQTIMFSFFATNTLCTTVLALLWLQYRHHFAGIGLWIASFVLHTTGLLLIMMRGNAPDWLSMVFSNFMIAGGTILLLTGLGQFLKQPGRQMGNAALLVIFTCIQGYFSIIHPSMQGRVLSLSTVFTLISIQIVMLMLFKAEKAMLPATRPLGIIFLVFIMVNVLRFTSAVLAPPAENFFRESKPADLVVFISYQMIVILLTFNLFMLISRRLFLEAQEKHSLYRQMFAEHSAIQLLIDPDSGGIVEANPAAEVFYGYPAETLQKMNISEINTLPAEEVARQRLEAKGKKTNYFVFSHRLASGEIRHVEVHSVPIEVKNRILLYSIIHDVSERLKAEISLAQKITQLRANLENTPNVAIQWYDESGRVIYWNHASEIMYGWPAIEALDKTIDQLNNSSEECEEFQKILQQIKATGKPSGPEELQFRRRDGSSGWALSTAYSIPLDEGKTGFVCTDVDITAQKEAEAERVKLEQNLNQMQRLDSIGVLAGGIAHDFNNLLAGIFGYIDMAREKASDPTLGSYLSKAMNTIDRARGLTHQLLTFAKGGTPVKKVDSLFPFVRETALFALSGSNLSCAFKIPDDLWLCSYDRNQIAQVIDNLVINAQQAMPDGGEIVITAANAPAARKNHSNLAAGDYVQVSVIDTGVGIPSHTLPRIFDPFYTTKSKGHGLGLSTCYSIIIRHGGCIEAQSEPGKGSTFTFFLPAAINSVASETISNKEEHHGNGKFLLMDDEEIILEISSVMLASFGYEVVRKTNGVEAVDYFASELKAGRKIAGMIFDLTVPGQMGGIDAVREVRKLCKTVPVFVSSGYAEDQAMSAPTSFGFTASISKPFQLTELAHLLNRHMPRQQ